MKQFAALVYTIGTSTKTNEKLQALQDYFATAPEKDMVWVIAVFTGRRPKRIVNSTFLKNLCINICNIPSWLFEECYHTAGDLGETISLLRFIICPRMPSHFHSAVQSSILPNAAGSSSTA